MRGFTLIEQLAALAILGIGLLGSARLFAESLQAMRDGARHVAAVAAAQNLLEQIVATGAAGKLPVMHCAIGARTCPDEARIYLTHWQTDLPAVLSQSEAYIEVSDAGALRNLVVRLHWRDSQGNAASRQLQRSVRR